MKKFWRFVRDPRQIWFWPRHWKRLKFARIDRADSAKIGNGAKRAETNSRGKIYMSLTVDLERDWGSLGKGETETLAYFFKVFPEVVRVGTNGRSGRPTDRQAMPGGKQVRPVTFFVQGDLVEKFSGELKKLQQEGHELGLHGFHHELWGKEQWFLPDQFVPKEKRKELLKNSLEAFSQAGLKRPVSFRAPNLVVDEITYELLSEFDFRYDSSAASFLGAAPLPYSISDIFVVPATADLKAEIKFRHLLPFVHYAMLDLYHVLSMRTNVLISWIERVIYFQLSQGVQPHLVFFCHPWEFSEPAPGRDFSFYCSKENHLKLENRLQELEKVFNFEYVRFGDLCQKLKQK